MQCQMPLLLLARQGATGPQNGRAPQIQGQGMLGGAP